MKKAGYIILLFFPLQLCGQTSNRGLDFGPISMGAVYSPDYCFRTLNYSESQKWAERFRNEDEVPMFGYTAGISGRLGVGKNFRLETGLYYSVKGMQTRYSELVWGSPDPALPLRRKTKYQFKYLDVPLKFTGIVGSEKLKFFIFLGVAANIYLQRGTKIFSEYADGRSETKKSSGKFNYQQINMSVLAGLGMEYRLSQRFSVTLQPEYRRFVTPLLKSDQSSEYLYSIGANVGVYYFLKGMSDK